MIEITKIKCSCGRTATLADCAPDTGIYISCGNCGRRLYACDSRDRAIKKFMEAEK